MSAVDDRLTPGPGTDAPGDGTGGGDGSWFVRALLLGAGLVLALGMAWYVAEGYRRAGPGSDGSSPAAAPEASADSGLRAAGRTRESRGRSRWLDVRAPVITFPTLSGDTASLAGQRGRAVVLNFWATWCPPCKREIPELARLQDSLRSEPATVIGVAVSSGGSREEIRSFGEAHGINYPVWISDPGTAASEYRAVGLPLTLLVDRRGNIRRRYMGPQTYESLRGDVRALLDSASVPPGERPSSRPR